MKDTVLSIGLIWKLHYRVKHQKGEFGTQKHGFNKRMWFSYIIMKHDELCAFNRELWFYIFLVPISKVTYQMSIFHNVMVKNTLSCHLPQTIITEAIQKTT